MREKRPAPAWFVILRTQQGYPIALVDEAEEIAIFDSEEEAERAGKSNLFGEHFGYRVYEC